MSGSNKVKRFFYGFDLFSCIPSLRARGQSDVSSICGGVTSMMVMIFFIYIFISDMIDLGNLGQISSTQKTTIERNSGKTISDLVFAIGINNVDLPNTRNIFSIRAEQISFNENQTTFAVIQFQPCTQSMWSALGTDLEESFQDHKMSTMLCANQSIVLSGLKRTDIFTSLVFRIQECTNSSGVACSSDAEISSFLQDFVSTGKYFVGKFLYLNTGFNLKSQDPEVKFVEDHIWLTFTQSRGTQAFLEIGNYEIATDQSFLPFENTQTLTGNYLAAQNTASFERTSDIKSFIQLQVSMSQQNIYINRSFGKVDDRLSYIGGLFELVIIFLSFFIASYNVYRYELIVSDKTYTDTSGDKAREEKFNFFTYIKYVFYDWFSLLCCCQINSLECKKIKEACDEVNEQLDVEMLLRRITHLQDVIKLLIPEKQQKTLYLKHPHNIETHIKNRKYLKYYDHVIQNDPPFTIQNIHDSINMKDNNVQIYDLSSEISVNQKIRQRKNSDSFVILDQALKMSEKYIKSQEQILQEQDFDIEQEMANAYFDLSEARRQQIQKHIPLKILKRLKNKKAHHDTGMSEQIIPRPTTTKIYPMEKNLKK